MPISVVPLLVTLFSEKHLICDLASSAHDKRVKLAGAEAKGVGWTVAHLVYLKLPFTAAGHGRYAFIGNHFTTLPTPPAMRPSPSHLRTGMTDACLLIAQALHYQCTYPLGILSLAMPQVLQTSAATGEASASCSQFETRACKVSLGFRMKGKELGKLTCCGAKHLNGLGAGSLLVPAWLLLFAFAVKAFLQDECRLCELQMGCISFWCTQLARFKDLGPLINSRAKQTQRLGFFTTRH